MPRDYDTEYNYIGSEGMYQRIARLTDYAELAKVIEQHMTSGKYDVNIRETGMDLHIRISPKAVTSLY